MDVTPHYLSFLRQRSLGRRSGPWGLQFVCFFCLGLSKGENRFRSESFALQIHWEVRGQGSGFQQHRFSRVWCSGRLDGVRHVAFSRQTQVRILQTQSKMYRRESPNSWCNTIRRLRQAARIPKLLENMRENALRAISNRGVSLILSELLGSAGKLDPGSALDFFSFRSGGWHEWQRRWVINPLSWSFTSKCFQPHTALLLGPACRSSAPSLWGCNINTASLKVQQLLKLSWSLPITVRTQSVQQKYVLCA